MESPLIIGDLREFKVVRAGNPVVAGGAAVGPSEPAVRHVDRALRTIRDDFNFETILNAVEVLEPYVAARTMVEQLSAVRPILTAFTDPMPRYDGLMNWQLLWQLRWDIIRLVRERVIGGASTASDDYLHGSDAMLTSVRDAFVVHALNLNYDDLLERGHAWEDGFPPTADGWTAFDRARYVAALSSGDHVMTHLHGSVRYGYIVGDRTALIRDKPQRQVVKYAVTEEATRSLQEAPLPSYTDDVIDDAAPIISGANKVLKFTTPPYSYYYSALQQALQSSDRILCLGYGFGDPHVNNWIREAIAHHGETKVRLAVVDYRDPRGPWPLRDREMFLEVRSRLGPIDLDGAAAREFVASGNICVTLEGYPPRSDIVRRIVEFLAEDTR
jgi:hypothetical protein